MLGKNETLKKKGFDMFAWLVDKEKPSSTFYNIALAVSAIAPGLFALYLLLI